MANVADSGLAVVTSVLDTDIVAVTVDPDGAGATTNRISVLNLFKGRTLSATVAFGIRSSGAAFDLQIKSTEVFTANRALTVVLNNAARTLTVAGDASVSGTNTGDQTSVSGNAGSATVLATPRAIYGNNFDGSAALTQIIASTFGGTGNGFTKFSGPTTAEKTFTLPDANATIARTDAGQTFTGVQVMTSPSITTSLVTVSTTFALLNTTATTINFAGACTTLNIGASATCVLNFGGGATASEFRFLEPSGSGTNYSAFKAVAQAANITYSLPPAVGAAGTVLTDVAGDGVLTWAAGGGSGTAAGSDTQVQFNDGGTAFGGDAGLTYNKTTNVLTITAGGLVLATSGTITQTSASATALEVGPGGGTNPTLRVVCNVASAITGLSITGNASGSGVTLTALGGTDENITLTGKGTGIVVFSKAPTSPSTSGGSGEAWGAGSTSAGGIAIGIAAATNDGGNATAIAIGYLASTSTFESIVIGRFSNLSGSPTIPTASGQLIIGTDVTPAARITHAWIGGGRVSATPVGFSLHGTGGAGTNIVGSNVAIAGGIPTGTGAGGHVSLQTAPTLQASGTSANSLVDRLTVVGPGKALTSGNAVSLFEIALPTLAMTGGTIRATIICTDGTDMQSFSQIIQYSAVNKGAAYTSDIAPVPMNLVSSVGSKSVSAGTLTTVWSILTGTNKVTIQLAATTSLTASRFFVYYEVMNNSEQAITPL